MSLLEIDQRRSRRALRKHGKFVQRKQRKQRKPTKRPSTLAAPFDMSNDNQVLAFLEWCQLNRISERTGRRIIRSGQGPAVVHMSDKKIGVTIGANKLWQQARSR